MLRKVDTIISEIRSLIDELEQVSGIVSTSKENPVRQRNFPKIVPKGALGAINMLMEEGFFDEPKEIGLIMEKLKEVGHYHQKPAVAMNLLNLTKRRVLNRFKSKKTKNWEYAIRK